ncbi:MAG: AAA family ATPase [Rhodomicrobium sp.]|nr:AAA family ATPase [Rhodomicrobium sp.]
MNFKVCSLKTLEENTGASELIEQAINFQLPKPWRQGIFSRSRIGVLNFLVGPNGSGKTCFAASLKAALPKARLLGTDRLQGMGMNVGFGIWGDHLAGGYQKSYFEHFKRAGISFGSALDTFILLEERPDLRVKVEATLTSLFNRQISLEWDSGNLVPKATSRLTGESYRIDREECHGIRELLVLLTHLYDDAHSYLIIDEPELNLHPQYQAFFMQEVRKVAGHPLPGTSKKGIFLITHSPFIIDIRSSDDLCSIISFSADHSEPTSISNIGMRLGSLIPRLNVHHKQLFFF